MTPKTVWRTIQKYKLLTANPKVVVAVSGGADSMALLHIMVQLRSHFGLQLHVASLHHGIRGQAAQDDLDFVQQTAEQWQLPYTLGQADVPRLAKDSGMGIEAAARQARYDFLAQVARQTQSERVAVAHHAKDQAETILMHIIRGSGLNGLRGMRPIAAMPSHPDIILIRPLLEMPREDLESYCAAHELHFRHDDSNDDISLQRNFIRHEVLSRLQQVNPGVVSALTRLADSASVDDAYLSSQFEAAVMPRVSVGDDGWCISREVYAQLHLAMQRRLLREAFRQLGGGLTLNHENTLELVRWAKTAVVGARRDLGGAIQLRVAYEDLCIEHQSSLMMGDLYRLIVPDTNITLPLPSCLTLNRVTVKVSSEEESGEGGILLPADVTLCLRTRRAGERFKPKGMGGKSRKIKDWMIDRKIPRQIRHRIPLVSANDEVIAICVGDTWHLADLLRFKIHEKDGIYLMLD